MVIHNMIKDSYFFNIEDGTLVLIQGKILVLHKVHTVELSGYFTMGDGTLRCYTKYMGLSELFGYYNVADGTDMRYTK